MTFLSNLGEQLAPPQSEEEVIPFCNALLQGLLDWQERMEDSLGSETNTEPVKKENLMLRYADGTDWNPGSGPGFYYWNGSLWVALGGLGDDIEVSGVTILDAAPILVFRDSNGAGAASTGFIEWRDSGGGRAGYFGNASSGDDDLSWANEQGGHIKIITTGAGELQVFAPLNVNTHKILNVVDPTANQEAATKKYVDDALVAGEGSAKAWVNFNGTGTIAIRDSFNVTSITDLGGVGFYQVTWDTDFANANYSAVVSAMLEGVALQVCGLNTFAVGSIRLSISAHGGGAQEGDIISIQTFGDQ